MLDKTYNEFGGILVSQRYHIEFYETLSGHEPAKEFIDSLDFKMQAKILRTLDLLEANGPELRQPYSLSLGNGIFELRIKQGNNITRILYFFFVGQRIILTNGFVKKSQKTPPGVLDTAQKYRADFIRRNHHE